jgi:Gpi18-like mannosyltransferase
MTRFHRNAACLSPAVVAALLLLGLAARTRLSDVTSDMSLFLVPWFDHLHSQGIAIALGESFSNYTPPYTYLLALMTLTASFLPKVTAIKLISIIADVVNAFLVYRIVRLQSPAGLTPAWAAAVFLCLPTVYLNSTIWGQADAVYTVFLLAGLYYFLKEETTGGMLAFSLAFAFKAQAVFLVPFLAVLLCTRRIRPWQLVLVPAVYAAMCVPTVLLGRGWLDVLTVYLHQSETYHWLSGNAPNLYIFVPRGHYRAGLRAGLVVAAVALAAWVAASVARGRATSRERLVLLALVSVALTPFLLPKMHDRYFYPADVLSLVLAFTLPETWFVPLAFQASSLLAYTVYLRQDPVSNVEIGALINLAVIGYLLYFQLRRDRAGAPAPRAA